MTDSLERYSRQTRFAPLGESGQRRLLDSSVLLVGCGALGSVLAETLTRAGVGHPMGVRRVYRQSRPSDGRAAGTNGLSPMRHRIAAGTGNDRDLRNRRDSRTDSFGDRLLAGHLGAENLDWPISSGTACVD